MGMPVAAYRWFFFEHGLRGLERNVLHFVGIRPIRETLFGMVGGATESRRRGWLKRMKEMGRKAA
jgi:putative NADPH-quinone reductase